jgi:hypothetical protein
MPENTDLFTGMKYGDSSSSTVEDIDSMELPEDRFHKKDAASTFLINQREQAVKDKWEKHERSVFKKK